MNEATSRAGYERLDFLFVIVQGYYHFPLLLTAVVTGALDYYSDEDRCIRRKAVTHRITSVAETGAIIDIRVLK